MYLIWLSIEPSTELLFSTLHPCGCGYMGCPLVHQRLNVEKIEENNSIRLVPTAVVSFVEKEAGAHEDKPQPLNKTILI